MMSEVDANLCRAQNMIDKIWQRKRDTFMQRVAAGRPIEAFPDLSETESDRTASQARSDLAAFEAIDLAALPHQVALTVKLARFQLGLDAQAFERYWLAQDFGMFPAMFSVGPYGVGYLLSLALKTFTDFVFSRPGDGDRYFALLEGYASLIEQMSQKLTDQAARGIRIPQPAIAGMRTLVVGQAERAHRGFAIDPLRLGSVPENFNELASSRLEGRVMPAFARLLEAIGEDYAAKAPEGVGMAQFKEGDRVYESLTAEHLSMSMTIDAIHQAGHDRMARIEQEMERIRRNLGYSDRREFHHFLVTNAA